MAVNRYDDTRAWYAISTYSGYEDKVADSIRQRLDGVDFADKIFDVMVALKGVRATAPVHIGDVILPDVCHTGVDIIATRNA